MKSAGLLLALLSLAPVGLAGAQAADAALPPEEFVVIGRQPGPPLWKVRSGEHVLWIFPRLSLVPKGMIWESGKVAKVLAEADEVLEQPNVTAATSPRLLLNPINIVRGLRLANRLSGNPDGATLQQTLPPDLYARYATLKAKYFPRENDLEELRPALASARMVGIIHDKEGLNSGGEIVKALDKLIRRQRGLTRTPIEIEVAIKGGYREVAGRVETLVASLDPADERACFESSVGQMEHDLDARRSRANAWAQGHIDALRLLPPPGSDEDPCFALISGSSEAGNVAAAFADLEQRWLTEAERALRENRTTFAIMDVGDLLRPEGPIARLREKGYEIVEP